jgi:hypothetical protein
MAHGRCKRVWASPTIRIRVGGDDGEDGSLWSLSHSCPGRTVGVLIRYPAPSGTPRPGQCAPP